MMTRGLSTKTTVGFSQYRTELVRLNNSLESRLRNDDNKLVANYISTVGTRRIGSDAARGADRAQVPS